MSDELELGAPEGGAPEVDQATITEALDQGWVPQEKWTGKPDDWTDAETFVRRGREINPILRKSLDREKKERQRLEAELAEMKGTVAELAEYREKLEKTVYERALRDLKAQKAAAMAQGDFETVSQTDEAIDDLKDNAPKPKPKAEPKAEQIHPEVAAWMERNQWYKPANEDMVDYANGIAIRCRNSGMPQSEILDTVTDRVKRRFPEAFTAAAPAMFDSGGSGAGGAGGAGSGSRASGKGFSSLPPEAKAQFDRFYKQNFYPKMKKEEAQAQYFADYPKE